MHCHVCGTALPQQAAFCQRCGSPVAREASPRFTAGSSQPHESSSEPAGEDLSRTRELPTLASPTSSGPSPAAGPTEPTGPTGSERPAPRPSDAGSRGGPPRSNLVAMVAAFVVLAVIALFALVRLVGGGPDGGEATASKGAVASSGSAPSEATEGSQSPTQSPSQSASQQQSQPPSTPSASKTGADIPAEARRCSTSGNDAVATAYAGTDRTSCEFAVAVREAYRRAGTPSGATSIRAYSPVTKKWYTLTCDGGTPVRCETSSNALILLAP